MACYYAASFIKMTRLPASWIVAAQPFDFAKAWIRSSRFGSDSSPTGHTRAKLFSKTVQEILDSSRSRMCLASASIKGNYRIFPQKSDLISSTATK
jgi:hypothetical protein